MGGQGRKRGVVTLAATLAFAVPFSLAPGVTADEPGPQAHVEQTAKKKAKAKKKAGLVLAPRNGRTYRASPAGPFHVLVRARSRDRVRLSLNGTVTAGGHSRIDRARLRKLRISPNHGLRHGRNVLRVRVKRRGVKRARTQVVRFRIVGKAPLAAAGRDRRVAVHARIRLNGRRSRVHPRARVARGELRHRWRILRAPKGSRLAKGKKRAKGKKPAKGKKRAKGKRRARASARKNAKRRIPGGIVNLRAPALFAGRNSPLPSFRPDQPGTYLIELRVAGPRRSVAKDVVEIEVNPDPMVTIDTITKPQGQKGWGVRVGTKFYPDPGESQKWLQVVALKSDSLELISNTAYDCPEATANPFATAYARTAVQRCTKQLAADLTKLRNAYKKHPPLVIAVSQPSSARGETQPPIGALTGLNAGIPGIALQDQTWLHVDRTMLRGRLSVVGSARAGSTTLHQNRDLAESRDDGEIVGALLRDNRDEYVTYASLEHPRFDTQAPGSDATKNVMRVGDATFTAQIPAGSRGGFHVVLVERQGLDGKSYWFDTGDRDVQAVERTWKNLAEMRKAIEGFEDNGRGYLAFVASRGDTRLKPTFAGGTNPFADGPTNVALIREVAALVGLLANKLGGTYNHAYQALDKGLAGQHSYTLIGEFGTGPARGIEVDGPAAAPGASLSTAPVVGTLTRGKSGNDYGFDVEAWHVGDKLTGVAARKLRETAFSRPGPWPEQGNAGRTAAVVWVAEKTGLDPRRGHFWTNGPHFDWDAKVKSIGNLSYPDAAKPRFDKGDFEWARTELTDEIGWFKTARAFVADLAEPFKGNSAMEQWAIFSARAAEINKEVQSPPNNPTATEIGLFMEGALSIAATAVTLGGSEKAAAVIEAIVELVKIGAEWARLEGEGGGEADAPFEVTAGKLGEQLQDRLRAAQQTLENQLLFLVAADYRKLRTVGECASLDPATCPDPIGEWQYTRDDQRESEEALEAATWEFVTGELMDAKYRAWAMPLNRFRAVDWEDHQPAGQDSLLGLSWQCPFHALPDTAQLSLPIERNHLGDWTGDGTYNVGDDTWKVLAYAERTGAGNVTGDPFVMHLPKATVTDPLFKPGGSGLGLDRERFYWRYMAGRTSNVGFFPHEGRSSFDWITKDSPAGVKDGCGW